jgi:hypothetical protein
MKSSSRLHFANDAERPRCDSATAMQPRQCDRDATAMRAWSCIDANAQLAFTDLWPDQTAENTARSRKIQARYRMIQTGYMQKTWKIQTRYIQIQTCMYELVSNPKIQTSYRFNTNTILFQGESHTYTFKQIHAHSVLSVLHTDMYVSNTNMSVWCLYLYVSFCTYIQDKSVTMLSVCAQRYIQIQTCKVPDELQADTQGRQGHDGNGSV